MTATESFMSVSQVLHGVLMEQFKSGPAAWVKRRERPAQGSGKAAVRIAMGEFRFRLWRSEDWPALGLPRQRRSRRSAA